MSEYSPEIAEQKLQELAAALRTWEVNRESDSAMIRLLRSKEYQVAVELAESLVYGVQEVEQRVQLKVGSTAIKGCQFPKGIVDPHKMRAAPLLPGSELAADRTNRIFNHRYSQHELILGNQSLYVDLGTIAVALQQDGELSLAARPLPE